jgi:hypothetical protein
MKTATRTPLLYFDTETFSGFDKPSLDDISAPANYTDPVKIEAYKFANLDKIWRRQALDPLKAEVICLSYAIDDGEVITIQQPQYTEKDIIDMFAEVIKDNPYPFFVGHNISRFDIPILWLRAVKYKNNYLRIALPTNKYDDANKDTLTIFSAGAYGSDFWYSLEDIAKFLGLNPKQSKGSEIHDMYVNKEYEKIASHCKYDVELVRDVYKMTI